MEKTEICCIMYSVAGLLGGFHFQKEVVDMSTYEILHIVIDVAVLIVMISGTKK